MNRTPRNRTPSSTFQYPRRSRPHGAILVIVISLMVVVMLLLAGLTRLYFVHARYVVDDDRRQQAEWLADSALQKGFLAAADEKYAGETWNLTAEQLGDRESATIHIRVVPPTMPGVPRRVVVDATVPSTGVRRFTAHRETAF